MALVLGLSDSGLIVPRTADYLDEIRSQYASLTGYDVDWGNDLVLGVLSAIMAQLLDQQAELLQAVYDSFNVNNAAGVQLSNLSLLSGVARKLATHGQVGLTLTGTPGTAIPSGRLAGGGGTDGLARWSTLTDVTIGAGGTVDVVAAAVDAGRVLALAGEVDAIVTPVSGWTAVSNALAASPGSAPETDTELRIRRAQSIQLGGGIGIASIRAKLLALSYVQQAAVIDNPDNEPKVVEGIPMQAHSFLPIVLPSTLTVDQQAEILRLLYDNTPVATRSSGSDVVGTVTGADGFQKTVAFDYADLIAANIVTVLTMASGYSVADAGPAFRRLVEAYIGTLRIGDPLTALALAALAFQVPGVLGMTATINLLPNLDATAVQQIVVGTWTAS